MYHQHFGLQEEPFSIKVNPAFLFMTQQHKDALGHLLYGASTEGGFAVLTGEVGTGKTTLIRALLKQLPEGTDIALVMNPALSPVELLASICDELGIEYSDAELRLKPLTDKLQRYLLERYAEGRTAVVLIDEAQHLQVDALEQVRLLTNLETDTRKLLQIILVGQPELDDKLAQADLRQLAQRVTARYRLGPLSASETAAYIDHRLGVAGLAKDKPLFPASIVERIHQRSEGVPRLINVLCDRIMMGCYARNLTDIDAAIVEQAITEVFGEGKQAANAHGHKAQSANPWLFGLAAAGLAGLLLWWNWSSPAVEPTQAENQNPAAASAEPLNPPDAAAVTAATEARPEPASEWWANSYADPDEGLNALLHHLDFSDSYLARPCEDKAGLGIACFEAEHEVWQQLQFGNRISLLQIRTPQRFYAYLPLLALDDKQALVLLDSGNGEPQPEQLALSDIGELWTGKSTVVWQPPQGYSKPLGIGSQGAMVSWIAERFATIDQQDTRLAQRRFTPALAERVKLFQASYGLHADGIVGVNTLLKLRDRASEDPAPLALGQHTAAPREEGEP